jgi:hypothetical protein
MDIDMPHDRVQEMMKQGSRCVTRFDRLPRCVMHRHEMQRASLWGAGNRGTWLKPKLRLRKKAAGNAKAAAA